MSFEKYLKEGLSQEENLNLNLKDGPEEVVDLSKETEKKNTLEEMMGDVKSIIADFVSDMKSANPQVFDDDYNILSALKSYIESSAEEEYDEPVDMSDVEADADTLASAGYGTDEDYGTPASEMY